MAGRLWDKGEEIDVLMHRLTVGDDPILDRRLIRWDCWATAAHARMLEQIGIISERERMDLIRGLADIHREGVAESFPIPDELEDGHTAIEVRLTEQCGDAGKKVHTGRSRNDQIIAATRLFLRHATLSLIERGIQLSDVIVQRFDELSEVPMPGYTHMQPAMPSSVGMWLHAHLEAIVTAVHSGFSVLERLDENPLGSAAGFGSGLNLDRRMTADLMGFTRIQRSPIHIQNTRGMAECRVVNWCEEIASVMEKLAWDMVLFCSQEYSFFFLPARLTTGSSIMPQKRNPDVAELLRGRAGRVRGASAELQWVGRKLPSNYHRDLQYTKGATMRAIDDTFDMFSMAELLIEGFSVNLDRLKGAMYPELFATYVAYQQVQQGTPFREAYQQTAKQVKEGSIRPEDTAEMYQQVLNDSRTGVQEAVRDLLGVRQKVQRERERLDVLEEKVLRLE